MIDEEVRKLILLCRDKKLDFDISISAKETMVFVLNLLGYVKSKKVDGNLYMIGDKYYSYIYSKHAKKGVVNFNNKNKWKAIGKILQGI